jgi:hypothetical protein
MGQMGQMEQMSPDEPIHGRPASAFHPPTLLRQHLPNLDDEITSRPAMAFNAEDIKLAAQLISMEEGMPLQIRSRHSIPDGDVSETRPESLDKSDDNIDYEALD